MTPTRTSGAPYPTTTMTPPTTAKHRNASLKTPMRTWRTKARSVVVWRVEVVETEEAHHIDDLDIPREEVENPGGKDEEGKSARGVDEESRGAIG